MKPEIKMLLPFVLVFILAIGRLIVKGFNWLTLIALILCVLMFILMFISSKQNKG